MDNELIKILLIDDDEDDFVMTRDILAEAENLGHELEWISTYQEALGSIAENRHDVYILDFRLGEKTGLELLTEAAANGSRAPFILLTGQGDRETDIQAMKAGAADYLVKGDINAPLLERSIRYAIERKRNEEDVFRMAYYDSLTRLPNRTLFLDRLFQAISQAERHESMFAIMFLDIDNFKRINDTFGHAVGDRLLIAITERLHSTMRKSDSVARQTIKDMFARLGGDEFTVLLHEVKHVENAAKVAQRIIDVLSLPFTLEGTEIFITASIGISIFPQDGRDVDDLLKNADAAMYHAKEQGKNNYQYYRQAMNASAFEKLTLENTLRKAVENDELVLHYQPQFDITTGKITGLEALIRWDHPEKGLIPPVKFIPLAEETGIIFPMSEWVLKTASRQCNIWKDAGHKDIPISVNISSRHFQHRNLVKSISESLSQAGINPNDMMIEITESAIMQDTETVLLTLSELADMGMRMILDDFGTGYSSLSYLKRFPIHALKIDRSFTSEISADPEEALIARAIISLARNLKMLVIAEGVETGQQLRYLQDYGCNEIQGYLFSRPLPTDDITEMLAAEKEGRGVGRKILDNIMGNKTETPVP